MPTALVSVEVVVAVLVTLAGLFLITTYARRRAIAGGRLLVLCGWRADRHDRWRLGLMRLGGTRLEWFSLFGLTTRSQHCWDRVRLELYAPGEVPQGDWIDLLPDAAPVRCSYGADTFELGLTPAAYTALRSWAEAAPPGSTADVA